MTGSSFVQYLHAVNIVGGNEVSGSPVAIAATTPGNGDGSVDGLVAFDAQRQNQRQGLTLVNGVVYVTFSSHCDWGPYHGWILGYDAATLQQQVIYNATPDGYAGGMWESGAGMAADAQGNLNTRWRRWEEFAASQSRPLCFLSIRALLTNSFLTSWGDLLRRATRRSFSHRPQADQSFRESYAQCIRACLCLRRQSK